MNNDKPQPMPPGYVNDGGQAEREAQLITEGANRAAADKIDGLLALWQLGLTLPLEGDTWANLIEAICDARDALPAEVVGAVAASRAWPGFPPSGALRGDLSPEAADAAAVAWYVDKAIAPFVGDHEDWPDEVESPEYLMAFLREYAEQLRVDPVRGRSAAKVAKLPAAEAATLAAVSADLADNAAEALVMAQAEVRRTRSQAQGAARGAREAAEREAAEAEAAVSAEGGE